MRQLVMIDIEQAGKTILDFIGTDDYKRILDNICDSKSGGFMSGLSFAYSLLMTKCDRYVYNMPEDKDQVEAQTEPNIAVDGEIQ